MIKNADMIIINILIYSLIEVKSVLTISVSMMEISMNNKNTASGCSVFLNNRPAEIALRNNSIKKNPVNRVISLLYPTVKAYPLFRVIMITQNIILNGRLLIEPGILFFFDYSCV